jgi:hypothetical protein
MPASRHEDIREPRQHRCNSVRECSLEGVAAGAVWEQAADDCRGSFVKPDKRKRRRIPPPFPFVSQLFYRNGS